MQKILKKQSTKCFKEKIMIAGSGGQGILFLGKILYLTAVTRGLHATYYPSYGAEVRGGTAKCMVTISNQKISIPIFKIPDTAIVLNDPSFKKYSSTISKCSKVILFQKMQKKIRRLSKDQDFYVFMSGSLNCYENVRAASYYAVISDWLDKTDILKSIEYILRSKGADILNINKEIFNEGYRDFKGLQ
ncbi:MAG: 2-oxoacid:acceptor oxidoreductase family protein [Candidatus Aureabacteria bacterium]|nr:2-oxoacid:acceptor oxidoreductase family protein [Candidatus Auribacterota bacterium]